MKKNSIISLIPLAFVLPLMSCGGSNEHVHTFGELVPLNDATCLTSGLKAHYQCSSCQKYFDAGKKEVKQDDLIIPAYGHSYGDYVINKNPTCEEDGSEYTDCLRCGETGRKTQVINHLGHSLVKVERLEADCVNPGHLAYYQCERPTCSNAYLDQEGKNKINNLTSWLTEGGDGYLAPTGIHTYGEHAEDKYLVSPADCENAAVYKKSCTCGLVSNETFVYGAPLGHNYGQLIAKVDKTCSTDGIDAHYHCDRCDEYFNANKDKVNYSDLIIAKGHEIVSDPALDPTFNEVGHIEGYTCKLCKTHYEDAAGTKIIEEKDWVINKLEALEDLAKVVYYDLKESKFIDNDTGLDSYSYVDGDLEAASFDDLKEGNTSTVYAYKKGQTPYKVTVLAATEVIVSETEFARVCAEEDHGYFVIGKDLSDVTSSKFEGQNLGTHNFFGTIDGRGHKINKITTADNAKGLFNGMNYWSKDYGFIEIKDLIIDNYVSANSYGIFGYNMANMHLTNVTINAAKDWQSLICGATNGGNIFTNCTFNLRNKPQTHLWNVTTKMPTFDNCVLGYDDTISTQLLVDKDSSRVEVEGLTWKLWCQEGTELKMNSTNFTLDYPFTGGTSYQLWTRGFASGTMGTITTDYAYGKTGTKFSTYNGMKIKFNTPLDATKLTKVKIRVFVYVEGTPAASSANIRMYRGDTDNVQQTDPTHYFGHITVTPNTWVETEIDASKIVLDGKLSSFTLLNEATCLGDPSMLVVGSITPYFSL